MTFRNSLRMLFSVALFVLCIAPLAITANTVAKAPAALAVPAPSAPANVSTAFCGRCGDGQCVKSCGETKLSCPIDCGGVGEPSAATAPVKK